jgi:hypothetical protein
VGIDVLLRRFRRANGESKKFWQAYRRAAEFAAPQINDFNTSAGQTKQPNVNNSQVLRSTNAFVCEVISSLTPPNTRWMELEPTMHLVDSIAKDHPSGDGDEIRRALKAEYERITLKFFECIDLSNFYAVEDKFIRAIGLGTGCLLINEIPFGKEFRNPVPFEFIYVPLSSCPSTPATTIASTESSASSAPGKRSFPDYGSTRCPFPTTIGIQSHRGS